MQTKTFGTRSEIIASNYLKQKGYKILEMNYKNKIGEIDIVAQDGNYLVFVEVKARASAGFGNPFEAINFKKQQKIRQVAQVYLMQKHKLNCDCRFDAVAVLGENEEQVEHLIDAF